VPTHQRLWDAALRWLEALATTEEADDGKLTLEFDEIIDAALLMLSANYRAGKVECVMLGLLDGLSVRRILMTAIDLETYNALKKRSQSESRSAGGPAAETPVTAPASES